MKKMKKFNDGGMTEDDVYAKPLAKASFKEAFAEARSAGDKTFEYMGKKYTTDMAPSTPKAKTISSPATPKEIGFKASPRMSAEDRVKKERGMKAGGMVGSASKRADGCCVKGKTKGKMV